MTGPETCVDCGLPIDDHDTRDDVGACPPVSAVTVRAAGADAAAHIARVMYGWPWDALTVEPFPFGLYHVTLHRRIVR